MKWGQVIETHDWAGVRYAAPWMHPEKMQQSTSTVRAHGVEVEKSCWRSGLILHLQPHESTLDAVLWSLHLSLIELIMAYPRRDLRRPHSDYWLETHSDLKEFLSKVSLSKPPLCSFLHSKFSLMDMKSFFVSVMMCSISFRNVHVWIKKPLKMHHVSN